MKFIVFYMVVLIIIGYGKEESANVANCMETVIPIDTIKAIDTIKPDTMVLLTNKELINLRIPYIREIIKNSKIYSLHPELVAGIIKQESQFKHYVRSNMNAIGLMQVIPDRAGQEVNKMLYKKNEPIEDSLLYNPAFNIKIGCAYIYNMEKYYFSGIENDISKRYCLISGYNTGIGNVIKIFITEDDIKGIEGYDTLKGYYRFKARMNVAINKINLMSSNEVREHLLNNLPCTETIDYLDKVVSYIDGWKNSVQVAMN